MTTFRHLLPLVLALALAAPGLGAEPPYATYPVDGVDVVVPTIGNGQDVLAVLPAGDDGAELAARLRQAFGSADGAAVQPLEPRAPAELALAEGNPGCTVVSLNRFLPAGVAALFNREPGFAGPNCFDAALVAAGLLPARPLRHVGNSEADQLLAMYFAKVPATKLQPGDVLVLNDGDHGVFYLGGGLVFHKKSFLKQHLYRIVPLERAYEPEPNEWTPGPFDDPGPFNTSETIRKKVAWRRTTAQHELGAVTPRERAQVALALSLAESVGAQAPNWSLARELGYFTERLLENLVADWSSMAKSSDQVVRACYFELESLRDQANQSIELELLSSPHAQAHATEVLKRAWLPRNAYSRALVGGLLSLYGRDPSTVEQVLDAIERDFDGRPLRHVKGEAKGLPLAAR